MKAFTIKQPYASLIAEGMKKVEIRTWRTHFRGELYIHAGKGLSPKKEIEKYKDVINTNNMPMGEIIAKCKVIDCVLLTKEYIDIYNTKNKDSGYTIDYDHIGLYGFVLDKVEVLEEPIKKKGMLSFWNFEL